ncbi:MAG: iron-containing alcohol dehydrogenase, partial [Rhodospirillaceae bacterium]|nr:iron-containing alcohol dehydrogenase [Rhodospirillaceae bacterium]
FYSESPFLVQREDEAKLMSRAAALPRRDVEAVGYLHRVLILCGLGVSFTGTSHHGSMGEHQISHYLDCFGGERRRGRTPLHGQQVGVASLTMARLQQMVLASEEPPVVHATRIDEDSMRRRYGPAAPACMAELAKKALDPAAARAMNRRLEAIWPELRRELLAFTVPVATMAAALRSAGGPTTAEALGIDVGLYREAVLHAREIRDRFSMLDLADDAGLLASFAEGEG